MALPMKKKGPMMPPPGEGKKSALTVAIGVGPKKPGDDSAMPKEPGGDEGGGEKCSPERAIVVKADEHCRSCENYQPEDGSCKEVEGFFDPEDACWAYFEPMGGDSDTDDQQMEPMDNEDAMAPQ